MVGKKTISAFFAGEEWASRIVFERYKRLIYFSISTILREKTDIDDAYQEALLRLFANKPEFVNNDSGLACYLVKAAKSVALDMARRSSSSLVFDTTEEKCDEPPTASYIISKHLPPTLSETEGEVIAYRATFALSFREISEIMGIPKTTVKRIYRTSMGRIRKENRKCMRKQ